MLRMSTSGKHSHSVKKRGHPVNARSRIKWRSGPAHWRFWALTVLLAAVAGGISYTLFPSAVAVPVADRLNFGSGAFAAPAFPSLLGQGQGQSNSYPSLPAPIVTATATAPGAKRKPAHPRPSGTATAPTAGTPLADAVGLGLYDGDFSPSGIETAASWLGSSGDIKYAEDFIDATDFSHIANPWQLSNWQGSPFTMIWGVPMVPCGAPATQCSTNVSDFDEVANGGANSYYTTLAKNLVAAGFGSSYIRLGWEFNADWMGWAICNEDGSGLTSWASDFVPAFRNIVTSMRSVSGANFKFIWNPIDSSNSSCPGASLENFYPGDAYVDTVALDVYDGIGADTSDSARWSDMLNGVNAGGYTAVTPDSINGQSFQGYGMNWLVAFAKAHNKQVSLPEWGLEESGDNGGGGDDSYFVTQMANWIQANATGPAIFWNDSGGTLPLDIPNYTSGGTPNASAAFKTAFGS
jgi:Glycosyl hydrolase family 26